MGCLRRAGQRVRAVNLKHLERSPGRPRQPLRVRHRAAVHWSREGCLTSTFVRYYEGSQSSRPKTMPISIQKQRLRIKPAIRMCRH